MRVRNIRSMVTGKVIKGQPVREHYFHNPTSPLLTNHVGHFCSINQALKANLLFLLYFGGEGNLVANIMIFVGLNQSKNVRTLRKKSHPHSSPN